MSRSSQLTAVAPAAGSAQPSCPGPPSLRLTPPWPKRASFPGPPSRTSSPVSRGRKPRIGESPQRASSPFPATSRSSPGPPRTLSLPSPPRRHRYPAHPTARRRRPLRGLCRCPPRRPAPRYRCSSRAACPGRPAPELVDVRPTVGVDEVADAPQLVVAGSAAQPGSPGAPAIWSAPSPPYPSLRRRMKGWVGRLTHADAVVPSVRLHVVVARACPDDIWAVRAVEDVIAGGTHDRRGLPQVGASASAGAV